MNKDTALGMGYFIAQSDAVGKTLLAMLLAMSVLSWAILALKGLTLVVRRGRSERFLNLMLWTRLRPIKLSAVGVSVGALLGAIGFLWSAL